jgi:RimJ/RimL family protein N-acetyltransferase
MGDARQLCVEAALYKLQAEDVPRVWAMYLSFEPKTQFQGLPPARQEQLLEWLSKLGREGADQFVLSVGERIVGHSMLCQGPQPGEAELAIFVHQKYRGHGLGRRLLLCTLNYGCKQLGFSRVWLSVQGSNPRAQHLFESIGFHPAAGNDPFARELDMERPLHCESCRGEVCAVFREKPPRTVQFCRDSVSRER